MTDPITEATTEIQRLHDAWFAANVGLRGELLKAIFAGERFFDYNMNGFRYDGVSEMEKLWSPAHMQGAFDILELANIRNQSIVASADMGWLTLEGDCVMKMITRGMGDMSGEGDIITLPFRITECYRRDDGDGNPEWRMWHFHCSPEHAHPETRFDPA